MLVVHDWGGLIGLRWACEHPAAVRALVISSTGFFPDGKWHGMAKVLRTPGDGQEALVELDPRGLWRGAFARRARRSSDARARRVLEGLRRPGAQARASSSSTARATSRSSRPTGRLAALDVPVLLLWGEDDEFAPVAGAHRFERELADTELVVVEGTGHFVWEDAPERCSGGD